MKTVIAALSLFVSLTISAAPFDPLTADEHRVAFDVTRAQLGGIDLHFPFIALREPSKTATNAPREAIVHAMHAPTNRLWIVTVDLAAQRVARLELAAPGTQAAVTAEEYVVADEIVRAHEPWVAAMRARGLDPDDVYIDVWAPGDDELTASGTRMLRALSFDRGGSTDDFDVELPQNPYVRPIEGVVVTIDMNALRVAHMTDSTVRPVSRESGNAAARQPALQPLRVTQPNGSSFEVAGRQVRWDKWQFHVVPHPREGLVLYDVRFNDNGRLRPIAHRLSLSEIYVPYGVPDANWSWRTAFDVGEYNLGTFAQTLEVNGDVPEHTYFFDAVYGTDTGETIDFDDVVGLYERDNGILWTRTDPSLAERDTRGRRELVVTWNAWIGNYIYGFDWIFGMDGTIEVKVVLTGTTLNRGVSADGKEETGAPIVGVDDEGVKVAAPNHQHFFSFRLDLDVDGPQNSVSETNIRHIPVPGFRNAFGAVETELTHEGFRDADPYQSRHWEVSSATARNAIGRHTAYAIESSAYATPLSSSDFLPLLRAAFARHAFWVTRHRDDELYAAGDFPNQGEAGEGLDAFTTPAEPVDGADIVVWHTIGLTHVPRPEDYPVMPAESIGFKLVPHGFFDRNPALDAEKLPKPPRRPRPLRRR